MTERIRRIDEWPTRATTALVVGTAFAYIAAYAPLYVVLGNTTGILAVVPVITAAWFFGFRIGLLAGFLGFVVNSLLVILVAETGWREWAADGGLLVTGALVLVGGVVGRLRDLASSTKRALTERRQLQEQLVQAQKMEAVGQLAGGVAHDFNNLLTVILASVEMGSMMLPAGEDRPRATFQEIGKAALRAADLTRRLLSFSRQQVVEPVVLNLNEFILEVDKMFRRLIGENIELVTIPTADLGMVRADRDQMEQVLTNLAINAWDAMPDGGKLVIETATEYIDEEYCRLHPGVSAGEYVQLVVRDTGIGMTEDVKARVFEPFFTTKEVGMGTGLGLSTCYGIVSQIGGHITVESEPGAGASFRIYLPRVGEVADDSTMLEELDEISLGTETVLLVEDEPMVRAISSQVLRERGYTVLEATNGVEALRLADIHQAEEISLLLSDVVMPLMGGRELAERVRIQNSDMKVLLTSGYADDALVRSDVVEPRTDFLPKPFTPVSLAHKVREVLDRR